MSARRPSRRHPADVVLRMAGSSSGGNWTARLNDRMGTVLAWDAVQLRDEKRRLGRELAKLARQRVPAAKYIKWLTRWVHVGVYGFFVEECLDILQFEPAGTRLARVVDPDELNAILERAKAKYLAAEERQKESA